MDKKEYVAPRITSFSDEEILAELGDMQGAGTPSSSPF